MTVLNFQPSQFRYMNPLMEGMEAGQNAIQKMLMAQSQRTKNQYEPGLLAQQLESQKLKNALANIDLQYAPQMTQAKLGLTQAQIPHVQAQTASIEKNTQLAPLLAAIRAQQQMNENGLRQQQNFRSTSPYQTRQALAVLPEATRASLLAEQPELLKLIIEEAANMGNKYTSNVPNILSPQLFKDAGLPFQPKPLQISGNDDGDIKPPFELSPEALQKTIEANKEVANNDLTTEATRKRAEAGAAIENLLHTPVIEDAFKFYSQYQGLRGLGRAELAQFFNQPGAPTIQSIQRQLMPVLSGSIKILEGVPTTNEGLKMTTNYFEQSKKSLAQGDPLAAMEYFMNGVSYLEAEANALSAVASPLFETERYKPMHEKTENVNKNTNDIFQTKKTINGQNYVYQNGKWYSE